MKKKGHSGGGKYSAAAVILLCILLCSAVGAVTVFALLYRESSAPAEAGVVQEAIMEMESDRQETGNAQEAGTAADQTTVNQSASDQPTADLQTAEGSTVPAETGNGPEENGAAGAKTAAPKPDKVVFVGDSRTVQMEMAVDYDSSVFSFVGESGMGYDWFAQTAVYQAEGKLGPYQTAVIINMGVNDLANVKKYAQLVNRKAAEWKLRGASVYYASVNPVNDGYPTVNNAQITEFNDTLRSLLSGDITWLDTYSFLLQNGYTATDGLHYDRSTYNSLYAYYLSVLGL